MHRNYYEKTVIFLSVPTRAKDLTLRYSLIMQCNLFSK